MSAAKINDGGPAFPIQEAQAIHAKAYEAVQHITDPDERDRAYTAARAAAVGDITLRDFFAAAALQGISAAAHFNHKDDIARIAFERADAMLKARAAS